MTDEQIYSKIESTYNSEKGKGFITHLIRSFLPVTKTKYLLVLDDKKPMMCALTKSKLVSKDCVLKLQLDNSEELFQDFVNKMMGKETNTLEKLFAGKRLAVESANSTKLLCTKAYQQLYNFVTTEMLNGNKHINFVISDELKKENKPSKPANSNPVNKPKSEQNVVHRSTTKLGDMDALSKLKAQLEKEGK